MHCPLSLSVVHRLCIVTLRRATTPDAEHSAKNVETGKTANPSLLMRSPSSSYDAECLLGALLGFVRNLVRFDSDPYAVSELTRSL